VAARRPSQVAGLDPNGQTLELRMPVDSGARRRRRPRRSCAARTPSPGRAHFLRWRPGLVAGVTFNLTDAFGFDGKFIIAKAEHRPGGEGYTCALAVRRCLEGY
jgi:hypothetical protein